MIIIGAFASPFLYNFYNKNPKVYKLNNLISLVPEQIPRFLRIKKKEINIITQAL